MTFYGRGYGHGVGMSQYGAKGRAQAGQTAAQILAAYFKGSTPGSVSAARNTRVLVLSGFNAVSSAPLVIRGRAQPWTIAGVEGTFPPDATLKVWRTTTTVDAVPTTTWRLRVLAADGTTVLYEGERREDAHRPRLELGVSPPARVEALVVRHVPRELQAVPRTPARSTSSTTCRSTCTCAAWSPSRCPSGWPTEALKAQVIAARSYAARRLHPTTGSYDIYDDTRSQVYRGVEAETSTTNTLIANFPGKVITYGGSIVNAFFFSTGGGATENNEYVFVSSSGGVGSAVPYLRGHPRPAGGRHGVGRRRARTTRGRRAR